MIEDFVLYVICLGISIAVFIALLYPVAIAICMIRYIMDRRKMALYCKEIISTKQRIE